MESRGGQVARGGGGGCISPGCGQTHCPLLSVIGRVCRGKNSACCLLTRGFMSECVNSSLSLSRSSLTHTHTHTHSHTHTPTLSPSQIDTLTHILRYTH